MNAQINRLLITYRNARKSWESWCFMVNFNLEIPNIETRYTIDSNPLLSHLRYVAMKDYYIELAKLLKDSKSNEDNIFKVLRDFALSNPEFKSKVEDHLNELSTHEKIIKRICSLRDKFYAHLDKDYERHIGAVDVKPIENCLGAIEKALVTLSSEEIFSQYLTDIINRNSMEL